MRTIRSLWHRVTPADLFLMGLLTSGSLAGLFYSIFHRIPGDEVVIQTEGSIFRYPLTEDRVLLIPGPLGETRVVITGRGVAIEASPCPHRICVGMGRITHTGEAVICIPNRILVRIVGMKKERLDGITQ